MRPWERTNAGSSMNLLKSEMIPPRISPYAGGLIQEMFLDSFKYTLDPQQLKYIIIKRS